MLIIDTLKTTALPADLRKSRPFYDYFSQPRKFRDMFSLPATVVVERLIARVVCGAVAISQRQVITAML
jgi:hypothetical protein